MPRHQHAQSAAPPVPPLNAEEVKFWLKIMEEHAVFIRAGLPCDQTDLIAEAKSFQQEFKSLRIKVEKIQSEKKFCELISQICCSLKEYIRYKRLLLCFSLTGKLCGALYPLFLDHLVREAEYFMALLAKMRGKTVEMVKALESDFWLRIMADHTQLLRQLVDPAETGMIGVVEGYAQEFDALSKQARVFTSMLHCQSAQFPVFDRFLKDSAVAGKRLRDFKKALHDMICHNKLMSIIPALMAEHMCREAEHFVLVLSMMEKGVVKNCKYNEASAAKYAAGEVCPVETGREFGELIEYADNLEGAPEREPVHRPNSGGKVAGAEKKDSAPQFKKSFKNDVPADLQPPSWEKPGDGLAREVFAGYEKPDKNCSKEAAGGIGEKPLASKDATATVREGGLSLPPPLAPLPETNIAPTKPQEVSAMFQYQPHFTPDNQTKQQKNKTGVKWPRQLGKAANK